MEARRYNSNKPKYSLIKLSCLEPMVRVLEYGRDNYSDFKNKITDEVFRGRDLKEAGIDINDEVFERVYDARDNWDNGLVLSEVIDSLERHIADLRDGEWLDKESGQPHIGHIQANVLFLGSKNIKNDLTNGE